MDPNANLAEQLRIARLLLDSTGEEPTNLEADRLAELVIALHEWIVKGGFLPDDWKVKP